MGIISMLRTKKLICLIIGLLICGISLLSCSGSSSSSSVVTLGVLVDLNGGASMVGEGVSAAIKIAVEDVNVYLSEAGEPFIIKVKQEETGADPQTALNASKEFALQGIDIVIGPQTSQEAAHLLNNADTEDLVFISQASAAFLAVPDDNLFRLITDDADQVNEISGKLSDDGIKKLIPVYRFDVYARDLLRLTDESFSQTGGILAPGVSYDANTSDFTAIVEELGLAVQEAIDEHGAGSVGVFAVAFDEAIDLFDAARNIAVLKDINWYGSESIALDPSMVGDDDVAQFAAERLLTCPTFNSRGDKADLISTKIEALIGRTPRNEALQAYDAVWLAALTYCETGIDADITTIRTTFPEIASTYNGVTGNTTLNAAGDRLEGPYAFWAIDEENDIFSWVINE